MEGLAGLGINVPILLAQVGQKLLHCSPTRSADYITDYQYQHLLSTWRSLLPLFPGVR